MKRTKKDLVVIAILVAASLAVCALSGVLKKKAARMAEQQKTQAQEMQPLEEEKATAVAVSFTDGVINAEFDKQAGTLTFSGAGSVDDTDDWLQISRVDRHAIKTIIFEEGIANIDNCEFSDHRGYINLEKVVFNGDIGEIGDCAFSGNLSLTTVEFNQGCRKIGVLAFYDCPLLEGVEVPNGCNVAQSAFAE